MNDIEATRATREEIVRRHMASENVLDFDTTMSTFKHPRYELIPYGVTHDGPGEVAQYFRGS